MHGFGTQGYSLTFVIVLLAIIVLRNSRPRRLKIERMWIRPVIFALLLITTLAAAPPPTTLTAIGLLGLGLIVGAALGWQRGRLMHIEAHPDTHELSSRASPLGMLLILGLVALRMGLRSLASSASVVGIDAAIATDALLALAASMMIAQSAEMWLRAQRVLAEAKAAKANAAGPPIVP
jgi:hypothetical protein